MKNKTLKVTKEALTLASQTHLKNIHNNELLWQKFTGNKFRILKSKIVSDSLIEYKYIAGNTLELQIYNAVLEKKLKLAKDLYFYGLELIESLPKEKICKHPSVQKYVSIFGPTYLENSLVTTVSNLDMVSDNMIINNSKLTLIDCEWVMNFPVELSYLKYRYIINLASRINPIITSSAGDMVSLGFENAYIPSDWLPSPEKDKLPFLYEKEQYFQSSILKYYHPQPFATSITQPNISINTTLTKLNEKINNLESQNHQLWSSIERLKGTKLFKLQKLINKLRRR